MNMWRSTWHYNDSELIEYLRRIRRHEPLSIAATYMLHREVVLQAQERGLIALPDVPQGDAHTIPFEQMTILNPAILLDEIA